MNKEFQSLSTDDEFRLIYDDRAKEEKDRFSFLKDAVTEAKMQAYAEGIAEGRRKGRVEGAAEGRAEGRAEGIACGKLMGQIKMTQERLGIPKSGWDELAKMNLAELASVLKELERQLQSHD